MINTVKTPKGNRFDILDNRRHKTDAIVGLTYNELEKIYWEIQTELVSQDYEKLDEPKRYGKSIPELVREENRKLDKKLTKYTNKKLGIK